MDHSQLATQMSELWNNCRYNDLEKLLLDNKDLFGEEMKQTWLKNLAHTLFMQDTRFDECARMYKDLLPADGSFINLDPTVLANFCVSCVLTGRNNEAEELIKKLELEEEIEDVDEDEQIDEQHVQNVVSATTPSHLTVVNLSIGTLYCIKNNYEFGLVRMFRMLEPLDKKLNAQTWFHVKRCILSLLDSYCRQQMSISDELIDNIVAFLIRCERHGLSVPCALVGEGNISPSNLVYDHSTQLSPTLDKYESIAHEARYLRALLLTIIHD